MAHTATDDGLDRAGLAARVATGLVKISLAIRHRAWQDARRGGLTPTQGQVLVTLHLYPDPGHRHPGYLARALALHPATISEALNALEAKGLIRRTVSGADRRAVRLDLTDAGRRTAEAAATWADFLAEAVESLAPSDQSTLLRLLIQLIRHLQLQGRIPVARMCVTCRFFRPYVHPDPLAPHHCDFVNAPFGDEELRLECPDHTAADAGHQAELWGRWLSPPVGITARPAQQQGGTAHDRPS